MLSYRYGYPQADHISWREWLALGVILGTPLSLLALGVYLLWRLVRP